MSQSYLNYMREEEAKPRMNLSDILNIKDTGLKSRLSFKSYKGDSIYISSKGNISGAYWNDTFRADERYKTLDDTVRFDYKLDEIEMGSAIFAKHEDEGTNILSIAGFDVPNMSYVDKETVNKGKQTRFTNNLVMLTLYNSLTEMMNEGYIDKSFEVRYEGRIQRNDHLVSVLDRFGIGRFGKKLGRVLQVLEGELIKRNVIEVKEKN